MSRDSYLLAIIFLSLAFLGGLFHSILLLRQEYSLIYLQSYATWYLILSIVALTAQLLVVRYFHAKKWRFIFIAGGITLVLSLIQVILQHVILITVERDLIAIHFLFVLASIVTSSVVAVAFIFIQGGHNKNLKWLGIFTLIHSALVLTMLFAKTIGVPQQLAYQGMLWLAATNTMFPLFYITIFVKEIKLNSYSRDVSKIAEVFHLVGGFAAMIALVSLFAVGSQLARESYWHMDWEKRGPAEARKLAERFERHIYVNDRSDTLHYLLLKPLNYDTTQKYPLVICLHGGPTRVAGDVEVTQPAPLLSDTANRKKYPAFLFVPQGRPGVLWGGIPGIPSLESLVIDAMLALEKELKIDETRRYITGISGGGYGTWHLICKHPDMFAAALPICGAGNPERAKAIVNVPVWAFHGEADRNVSVTGSRNMITAIRAAGGNPKYSEFPNVGHNVWPEVANTPGVLDWLFEQRLKSPSGVSGR